MALPKQKEIEVPLLRSIDAMGGEAKPQELYPKITANFPQITEYELRAPTADGIGNKWLNRIQWVRQKLVSKGELERYPRGIWRITAKGRERLSAEGPLPKGAPKVIREQATKLQPPKRHDELKQKMVEIGKELGYHTSTEEGPVYRHDVLWKRSPYRKDPCHVIEICGGGSLPKDFDSLNWARENLAAIGILITVDEADYQKAVQRFGNQAQIVVAKAETVDRLHELITTNLEFLRVIFREHS
jgi:hypothetical protein